MSASARGSRWRRWIKLLSLGMLCVVVLITVVGVIYEFASRWQARHDHPVAGTSVDVGGRTMQIDCRGRGSPTVVFEAGLDMNGSLSWSAVHDPVAQTTRACAYSRRGMMWSEPRPGPQTASTIAADLHELLERAGERAPFVLVGHSLGGPYIMTYTKNYAEEVAALVFVDASHPDQTAAFEKLMPPNAAETEQAQLRMMKLLAAISWTGLTRAIMSNMAQAAPWEKVTPALRVATEKMVAYAPTSMEALTKEAESLEQSLAEGGKLRDLGERPLVVLTAKAPLPEAALQAQGMTRKEADAAQAVVLQLHVDQTSWSSRSRHVLVDDATHYIQFDRPDTVIAAVRSVVEDVRRARGSPEEGGTP